MIRIKSPSLFFTSDVQRVMETHGMHTAPLRHRNRNRAQSDGETFTFKPLIQRRTRPKVQHVDVWRQSARASVWTVVYLLVLVEMCHFAKVFTEQWYDSDNLDRYEISSDGLGDCAKPKYRTMYPDHCGNLERWKNQWYFTTVLGLTVREHAVHVHEFMYGLTLLGNVYRSLTGWCGHGTTCGDRVHHILDTLVGCLWWAFPLTLLITLYYITTIVSKPWREWSLARDTYRRATRRARRRRRTHTWSMDGSSSSDDDTEVGVIHDPTSPRVEGKRPEGHVVASHSDLEGL